MATKTKDRACRYNAEERRVTITEGDDLKCYELVELIGGTIGRVFQFRPYGETLPYTINITCGRGVCTCLGHRKWGHKTVCKHVACVLKLIETKRI